MRYSYLRIAHSAGIILMYWLSCACVAKKFHQIVTPVYVSNLIIFVFSVSAQQHDGKMKLIWPSLAISPPSPHFNVLLIKPHEYSNEMAMNINKMRWICYLGSCHISRPSVEGAAVGTLKLAVYLTILHRSSLPRVRPTVTYILSYITTIKQSLPYYIFINIRLVSAHPASSILN